MKRYIAIASLMVLFAGMAEGLLHQRQEISRLEHFELNDPDDQCADEDTPEGLRRSLICTENWQLVENPPEK